LVTIAIIAAGYAYYFFVYVEKNERLYKEKAFRTLNQLSDNIIATTDNFQGNLSILLEQISEIDKEEDQGKRQVLRAKQKQLELINKEISGNQSNLKNILARKGDARIDWSEHFDKKREALEARRDKIWQEMEALNAPKTNTIIRSIESLTSDYNLKYIGQNLDSTQYQKLLLNKKKLIYIATDSADLYYLEKDLREFMEPLVKLRFFEELIIVRGAEAVAFQTFDNQMVINPDSILLDSQSPLMGGNTKTIRVNDKTYLAFVHNLEYAENENWQIVGCVMVGNFVSATRSIDSWIILYTSLFVLIILVSMPLLKLTLMSAIERLHMGNVFVMGLSVVLGSPLIILSFLILYNYFGFDRKNVDDQLESLSEEISSNFIAEIQQAHCQLKKYDENLQQSDTQKGETWSKNNILQDTSVFYHSIYPYFNEVFWLSPQGDQLYQMTAKEKINPLINLKKRRYFSDVRDGKFWQVPGTTDRFVFQSIISWSSMGNEVAISMESVNKNKLNAAVAVITSKLLSVIDVVLPMGYGFAFLDEDGSVLLHSEKEKVLQENFLKESEENHYLAAAISSHSVQKLNVAYHNKDVRMYTYPIRDLPLTLVVFYDMELVKTKISEIWFFALILILLSFFNAALFILVMYFTRRRPKNLEVSHFLFDWMSPSEEMIPIYTRLFVSNGVAVFFMFFFTLYFDSQAIPDTFRIVLTPVIIFCLTYVNLSIKSGEGFPRVFVLISAAILIALNLAHYFNFTSNDLGFALDLTYEVILILIFIPLPKLGLPGLPRYFKKLSTAYCMMLVSWLVSTSILPLYFYYNMAYSQEAEIWGRHELLDYMMKKESHLVKMQTDRNKIFKEQYAVDSLANISFWQNKLAFGNYWPNEARREEFCERPLRSANYQKVLFFLRPNFKKTVDDNRGLVFAKAFDGKFTWEKLRRRLGDEKKTGDCDTTNTNWTNYEYTGIIYRADRQSGHSTWPIQGAFIEIEDISFVHFQEHWKLGSLLIVLSVSFVVLLYFLIRFAAIRIYALDAVFRSTASSIKKETLLKILESKNLLLVGLANSGRTTFIRDSISKNDYERIDCMKISHPDDWEKEKKKCLQSKKQFILLDNFEYLYHHPEVNHKKLMLIESILMNEDFAKRNGKMIVVTEIDPKEIVDFYLDEIPITKDEKAKKAMKTDLQVWRHIFSGFIRMFKPLEACKIDFKTNNVEIKATIEKELGFKTYLHDLVHLMEHRKSSMEKSGAIDMVILEIQELAQPYYIALWNTLTKEERFVVYDLAKDGFVNVKNKPAILALLKKGLLQYKQKISLFNTSFSNFVLVTNKEEALIMEHEVSKKGNWSNIRTILVLIVISLIALMGFGQPDFFKNINAIVIAIASVASVIPTFNNFFNFSQRFKSGG